MSKRPWWVGSGLSLALAVASCGDDGSSSSESEASSGTTATTATNATGPTTTTDASTTTAGTTTDATTGAGSTGATTGAAVTLVDVGFDEGSHIQLAPGSDNWPMTWAADGNLYTTWGDGGGFGGTNNTGRVSLGYARVEGDGNAYTGFNVWGGANPENPATFEGKSYSLVSVGGTLYSWVGVQPGNQFAQTRLYRSDDLAASWTAAGPEFDTTMLGGAFSHPNILNFGADYAGARDEYVYTYWVGEKPADGSSSDVAYLTRVRTADIADLSSYEYFSGLAGEQPSWSPDVAQRGAVHSGGTGRVHWTFNVVYVAGLDKYVLINNRSAFAGGGFPGTSFQSDIEWLQADAPWGPWTEITTFVDWRAPGADPGDRYVFFFDLPSKWQSPDGLDFVMVFTGVGQFDSWNTVQGSFSIQ